MKKRYLVIIIALVLVLTGCETNYTLTIKDDTIEEKIDVILPENYLPEQTAEEKAAKIEVDDQITPYLEDDQYPLMNNTKVKYNRNIKRNNGMINATYDYTYTYENYKDSQIYTKCFEKQYFSTGKDQTYIGFKGRFYCMTGNEIVFNIKTDKKVESHNADRLKGNTYTWIIDNTNAQNIDIDMTISNKNQYILPIMTIIAITVIVVSFGMLGFAFHKLKNREAVNDI